jgi:hypothetical protein
MIPLAQRIVAILFSLSLLWVTVHLIRKHKLREEYALLWLAASVSIFLFSVFGGLINQIATFFSVSYSPTLALVAGLLFALILLLSQSVVISKQADSNRDLVQSVALLEFRLRKLEESMQDVETHGGTSAEVPEGQSAQQPAPFSLKADG